ncbi:zinc finger protein [Macleaya cordata]|uniref:Zinc finger protein n=1 Tax=Macleaya cordata TaxID=56857 RepID=A0A200QN50_MACCD|nr:zinc finger protein [Macleaya cordata]
MSILEGKSPSLEPKTDEKKVAIFWDLDNKQPKSFPPFDAAIRLKKAASSFGFVHYMIAYANHHAFSYVPPDVREQRKERKVLNKLENRGVIKPVVPYLCRVCGRKFHTNDKLVNHFKQLHEREQVKRLNRLESSRGKRRVQLVGKLSMKMEKYKNAARDVLTPKVGYGLADELKRAGFWVRLVSDKPQAADVALRNQMVEMMDRKRADCIVLVSDDSDFVDVLREAKLRCLKTVVVGDNNDGALKRCADVGFSWKEIMLGKAKKEAVSVVGRWKDRDVLKKLEWTYKSELGEDESDIDDSEFEIEDEDIKDTVSEAGGDLVKKEDIKPWWELDSDIDDPPAKSFK